MHRWQLWALLVGVVLAAPLLEVLPANGAAGDLDESFGVGGVAIADLGVGGDRALAIALQEDGRIVAAGQDAANGLAVLRFNEDGSLDTSFSADGIFSTDLVRRGQDVVVRPDGKILATGSGDEHLVRLNEDGSLDETFNDDGITGSQFFNPDDDTETEEPDMARLIEWPGNQVLVAGTVDYGPYFFTFARYQDGGGLDQNFGIDGQVQTDFSPAGDSLDQEPMALAPYPGNRFVAAGYRDAADDVPQSSVIAMYNADGTLDNSFSGNGERTDDFFDLHEQIKEVLPLPDGRILAIGDGQIEIPPPAGGVQYSMFIARYNANGMLDSSFGNSGVIIFDRDGSQTVEAAALAEDGSIIVGGDQADTGHHAFFARFDENGTPDPEFGTDGWKILDLTTAERTEVWDITLDENGDILAAGGVIQGGNLKTAVFKLRSTAEPPGTQRTWGDNRCNGGVDATDALAVLRNVAQLSPLAQTEPCPDVGVTVQIDGFADGKWADVNCDGNVTSVDALADLRNVAALPPLIQHEPCPNVGAEVAVTG